MYRPTAVTLALLFGLFTFVYGVWEITLGIHLHSAAKPGFH
jgi:hypothetical protein